LLLALSTILGACKPANVDATSLANPAAVFCEERGYSYQIREDADGNQYGVCVFSSGDECDAWAFYNGECAPNQEEVEQLPPETVGLIL
jgi:putative hemolysin